MNMRKEDKNTKTNESESMAASKVHAVDVAERSMCVNSGRESTVPPSGQRYNCQ